LRIDCEDYEYDVFKNLDEGALDNVDEILVQHCGMREIPHILLEEGFMITSGSKSHLSKKDENHSIARTRKDLGVTRAAECRHL
jgi:hypothetical protein